MGEYKAIFDELRRQSQKQRRNTFIIYTSVISILIIVMLFTINDNKNKYIYLQEKYKKSIENINFIKEKYNKSVSDIEMLEEKYNKSIKNINILKQESITIEASLKNNIQEIANELRKMDFDSRNRLENAVLKNRDKIRLLEKRATNSKNNITSLKNEIKMKFGTSINK